MGRPLFSQAYSAPAVRTEVHAIVNNYEKWSRWNPFDPDSEEFFVDAEWEAFVDPEQDRREQQQTLVVEGGSIGSDASSVSSDSSDTASDRASPVADGSDDAAVIIADAYTSQEWEQRFLLAGSADNQWRRPREERQPLEPLAYPRPLYNPRAPRTAAEAAGETTRSGRLHRPRSATVSVASNYLPPSSLRNSTTATEIDAERSAAVPPLAVRRTVNITPISMPIEPTTPSPISPNSPVTPPSHFVYPNQGLQSMTTPSPAPTVTPRIYNWNRYVAPLSPTSPSANTTTTTTTSGPLTNANARMSLTRINITHTRTPIQNSII